MRAFEDGHLDEARVALERAVSLDPESGVYHVMLGRLLLSQSEFGAAAAELERGAQLGGGETSSSVLLASAHVRAGRHSAAEDAVMRGGTSTSERLDITRRVGTLLLTEGAVHEAAEWTQRALDVHGDDPQLLASLAQALAGECDWAAAESVLRRGLALTPDSPELASSLSYALRMSDRPEEALAVVRTARAQCADDPSLAYDAGRAYAHLGDRRAALREHERAVELAPGHPDAHVGLGFALRELRLRRQARRAASRVERLLRRSPVSDRIWAAHRQCNLSTLQAALGDYAAAEAAARRAIEMGPQMLAGYQKLAVARALQGDEDGMAAVLQQARCNCPRVTSEASQRVEAQAMDMVGRVLLDKGDLPGAIAMLRRAGQRRSDLPGPLQNLAVALLTAGEGEEAARLLQRGLALAPNDPRMRAWLAHARIEQERIHEAVDVLAAAPRSGIASAELLKAASQAHFAQGEYDTALSERERLCELEPSDPEAHLERGFALVALGRAKEARAAAKRAERLALGLRAPDEALSRGRAFEDLARLRLELGDFRGAERAARRAVEATPAIASVHLALARVCEARGDGKGAISTLRGAFNAYGTSQAMERLAELAERLGCLDDAERLRKRGAEVAAELVVHPPEPDPAGIHDG